MLVKVIFNGTCLNDYFLVSDISRPLPEFREKSSEVGGMDGEAFESIVVGTRECSFKVSSCDKGKSAQQSDARRLMSILSVRKPALLTFSDELDKDGVQLKRYAVPTGKFDAEEYALAGRWTCSFKMHDPFLYGKNRSIVLSSNAHKSVNAGGNAPSWATATSCPSGNSYSIVRTGYGFVGFSAPFSGQNVTVDFEAQKVSVSPSVANASGLQTGSRFFPLEGSMDLVASAQTTLSWTERWL